MKGQTLIEVLVALSAVMVIASAITVVLISTLNNTQYSSNQSTATKYAQEAMEIVHEIRDGNYAAFKNYNGSYCLGKGQTALGGSCISPNVDRFIRTVTIEQNPGCGANTARVTVKTSWTDNKCQSNTTYCHTSQIVSCLSTLNPIQGP